MAILQFESANRVELDAIVDQATSAIREDTLLDRFSRLPDAELKQWCRQAASGLHMWVAGQDSTAIDLVYYGLGRAGAKSRIPVRELVRGLVIVMNLGRDRVCPGISAREMSDSIAMFLDYAKYYLIRGFEDAQR
jgi:hypothetical protein